MSKNYLHQRNNHFANLVKKNTPINLPVMENNHQITNENKNFFRSENRSNLNCLYMLQTSGDIPELLSFIKKRE